MITSMRRCVACDDLWPWPISSRSFDLDFENRVRSVMFSVLDRLFFWLGIQYDPIVWVIMRRRGVSSERRRSSCSSCHLIYTAHTNSLTHVPTQNPDTIPLKPFGLNLYAGLLGVLVFGQHWITQTRYWLGFWTSYYANISTLVDKSVHICLWPWVWLCLPLSLINLQTHRAGAF